MGAEEAQEEVYIDISVYVYIYPKAGNCATILDLDLDSIMI